MRCLAAVLFAGLAILPAAAQRSSPEASAQRREAAGPKAPSPRLKAEAPAPVLGVSPASRLAPFIAPAFAAPPAQPGPRSASVAPPSPAPGTYGAFYLASPPRTNFGMVVGQRDRLSAHHEAETRCRAAGGSCVLMQDFTEPCIAVAEGVRRATGVMFMTSDPSTYRVILVTHGIASNPSDAERQAIQACMSRDRSLTCRPVQAACGPR